MSKLESALELANMGFYVFPLRANSKLPLIKDFPNKATRDENVIKEWWVDPILETENDWNVGISTSDWWEGTSLVVVDVDNKGEKKGDESLEELDIIGKETPTTLEQETPTGGRHLIYWSKTPLKQGVNVLGNGLDIRAKGGYIVGAGSTIDGKRYHFSKMCKIVPAPQWLIDQLGKAPEKSTAEAPKNINQETARERAIYYLENEAPESVKGAGGDHTAYKVAAKVKDFGVDETTCLELMLDHWFDGSGWSPEKLQLKIAHAYQYGNEPIGAASPEASFVPVEKSEEELSHLQKINKDYALVYVEGGHFIIHETVDESGLPKRVFFNEQTFKRRFSPKSLQKRGTWATEWLDWSGRREYAGICFAPEREARNNYYNLWRGFACSPVSYEAATADQKRGFDLFISHVKENICRGQNELYQWVMGFFAHLIQKPYERPLVTLVFKGSKGVGKNAMVDRIGKILGEQHYLVASDSRYLTSNFNGHMDSCLCLVLDEAFWSGDKSAEGKLKALSTSPKTIVERKGKEPYQIDNLVRLIIIGNEEWLVPASNDERRYTVCDIGEGKKQNNEFFEEMRILMDDKGGNQVLLDFFKKFDLSKVDINRAPKTQALLDQKISSLDPFPAWWYECLVQGYLANTDFGGEWSQTVDTQTFRNAFARYCKERNIHSRMPTDNSIGKSFKKMVDFTRTKRWENGSTVWVYKLPTLDEARKQWDKFIGQEGLWE